MDRLIYNSPYSLVSLRDKYSWLTRYTINDYDLFTVLFNIFLVFVPFILILYLKKSWHETNFNKFYQKVIAILVAIIWLIFIPNTAYIITEIRHLLNYCTLNSPDKVCLANAWMIMFFFTYASIG
jgi:uncharacterized membrane protein